MNAEHWDSSLIHWDNLQVPSLSFASNNMISPTGTYDGGILIPCRWMSLSLFVSLLICHHLGMSSSYSSLIKESLALWSSGCENFEYRVTTFKKLIEKLVKALECWFGWRW
jgi:hypothetical protein